MHHNVGPADQVLRIGLGVAFGTVGFVAGTPPWITLAFSMVGLGLIVTGAMRHCPFYEQFGLDTEAPASRIDRRGRPA